MNGVKAWGEVLKQHPIISVKKRLSEECPLCGMKITPHKPLDATTTLFHIETAHGIDHEIFQEMLGAMI